MSESLVTRRRSDQALLLSPQEDDDLLREILLRLPPLPSSLLRASLVCNRWRRLVSDPAFLRRFRSHHQKPPLLGFFTVDFGGYVFSFTPTVDPPYRINAARFSHPQRPGWYDRFHGCRNGLALILNRTQQQAVIWNPVTGDQRCVALPPMIGTSAGASLHGAVLCTAGTDVGQFRPFQLALVWGTLGHRSFACLYKSESGVWGNMIRTPMVVPAVYQKRSSVLVGNALYWLLCGGNILEFDLDTQRLAVIQQPTCFLVNTKSASQILRTEDHGLGLAVLSGLCILLWDIKTNSNGATRWVLRRTIELDKLFGPEPLVETINTQILGFAEDNNAIYIWWCACIFMIELESLQFKKVSDSSMGLPCYPYESFLPSSI